MSYAEAWTFTASFDGGDTLEGTFHAAFCAGGQDLRLAAPRPRAREP